MALHIIFNHGHFTLTQVGSEVNCFAYMLENFKPELLTYPFYENYSSSGDHGKKYSEREGREENVNYYPDIKHD